MNLVFMAISNTELTPQLCDFTVKIEFEMSHEYTAVVRGHFYVMIRPERIKCDISISAFRDTRQKEFHSEIWFNSHSFRLKAKQILQLFGPPLSC